MLPTLLSGSILKDHKEAILVPESLRVAFPQRGQWVLRPLALPSSGCGKKQTPPRRPWAQSTVEVVVAGEPGGKERVAAEVLIPSSNIRNANGAVSCKHSVDRIMCLLSSRLGELQRSKKSPPGLQCCSPRGCQHATFKLGCLSFSPASLETHCHTREVLFYVSCCSIYRAGQKRRRQGQLRNLF